MKLDSVLKSTGASQKLARLRRAYPDAFYRAVEAEVKDVFEETQMRVPVDTGALKDSGDYSVERAGSKTQAFIYYKTPYAGLVHEIHPTKGQYLIGPVMEAQEGMVERIAADIKQQVKK